MPTVYTALSCLWLPCQLIKDPKCHHHFALLSWHIDKQLDISLYMYFIYIGHVCFSEFTFRKTTFQTFLCLFAIRKVGQRKTLSGFSSQRKHFSVNGKHFLVKEKFGLVSRKVFSLLTVFVFRKSGFRETTFQTFLCLFANRKVGQRKTLSSQRKIWLGFQESVFLENLGGKHFPEVVKNLEMSLFADYIKFDPQTFDCYI